MFLRKQSCQQDYQKQLRMLNQDRQKFQQRLQKVSNSQANNDQLIEKYRFYIRDLLERPDGRAAKMCLVLSSLQSRITLLKYQSMNKIKMKPQNPLRCLQDIISRKKIVQLSQAFEALKSRHKCHNIEIIHSLSMIHHKRMRHAFNSIVKNTYFDILNRKDEYIGQIQAQLNRLEEMQPQSHQQDILKLQNDLKDKQKQIKKLQKTTKDIQKKYQSKIERLEQQVNKLTSINVRLIQEVQDTRNRRGDISCIEAAQHQNSISMELFEQGEAKKDVQQQLSQKYLRQVICLKQNIESIKANFIGLLRNGLQMDKTMLTNLLYLMNFNEDQKKMISKCQLVSSLLQ